jgi:hypothetical protein
MPNITVVSPSISARAGAIARGLRITGRIGDLRSAPTCVVDGDDDLERWLTLPARTGQFYFLRPDGGELRRGVDYVDAEPLQIGFLDAMERVGTDKNSGAESASPAS